MTIVIYSGHFNLTKIGQNFWTLNGQNRRTLTARISGECGSSGMLSCRRRIAVHVQDLKDVFADVRDAFAVQQILIEGKDHFIVVGVRVVLLVRGKGGTDPAHCLRQKGDGGFFCIFPFFLHRHHCSTGIWEACMQKMMHFSCGSLK